jgi:hypothetical protein
MLTSKFVPFAVSMRVMGEDADLAKLDGWLEKYPILKRAMAACVVGATGDQTIHFPNVQAAVELIEAVNPEYPQDSFSVPTLASMLAGRRGLSPEEYQIIRDVLVLKGYGSDRAKVSVSDTGMVTVEFGFSFKKSGQYYRATCMGQDFCFPFTFGLTVYADMDDSDNHSGGCPSRLAEADPDYSDDCNCEAEVAYEGTELVDKNEDGWKERVRAWVETNAMS